MGPAYFNISLIYYESGKLNQAIDYLKKALEIEPIEEDYIKLG